MEIRFIDEKHAADINIPNEPFPIRGRMVITYNGDRWEHTEKLLPSEQIEEMTFPDENYNYHEMKDYVFIGAYEGADCIGLAILTPVFNPCLFLYDYLGLEIVLCYRQYSHIITSVQADIFFAEPCSCIHYILIPGVCPV